MVSIRFRGASSLQSENVPRVVTFAQTLCCKCHLENEATDTRLFIIKLSQMYDFIINGYYTMTSFRRLSCGNTVQALALLKD